MYIFNENKFRLKVDMMCGGDGGGGGGGAEGDFADIAAAEAEFGIAASEGTLAGAGPSLADLPDIPTPSQVTGGVTPADVPGGGIGALDFLEKTKGVVEKPGEAIADFLGLPPEVTKGAKTGAAIGTLFGPAGTIGGGIIGGLIGLLEGQEAPEVGSDAAIDAALSDFFGDIDSAQFGGIGDPQGPGDFQAGDQPGLTKTAPKPTTVTAPTTPLTAPETKVIPDTGAIRNKLKRVERNRIGFLETRLTNQLGPLFTISPRLF